MPNLDQLHDRLRQCRRLHDAVLDPTTRDNLTAHAEELEAQIAEAEHAGTPPAGTDDAANGKS